MCKRHQHPRPSREFVSVKIENASNSVYTRNLIQKLELELPDMNPELKMIYNDLYNSLLVNDIIFSFVHDEEARHRC